MPAFRLVSDSYLATPQLEQLRQRARDLSTAGDWAGLLALRADLEQDSRYWPDLWGPLCAIAARRTGDPGATGLLQDLVQAGFCQPQLLGGELESVFSADPDWPRLLDRMAGHVPAAPLVVTEWPVITPAAPLGLLDLPHRAGELRALAPFPVASAWQTALATLDWVTHLWQGGNAHMEADDAIECLRRVGEGQRFACVEYSLVLAQVLNALGIPARRLSLRQSNYHLGIGRGHAVCEAWIDDFCRWVVLDGQNGLYWAGHDGKPLGCVELQQAAQPGGARPGYATTRSDVGDGDADRWFSYFSGIPSSTAGTWARGSFGMVFQRNRLAESNRLEHRPDVLYPDLSQLSVQTALDGERPALRLATAHPYARDFSADTNPLPAAVLPLDQAPGDHEVMLAARTGYSALPGKRLRYRVEA